MSPGRLTIGLTLMGFGVLALLASTGAVDLGATLASWWSVPLIVLAGADIATTRAIRVPTIILGLGGLVLLGATTGVFGGKAVGLLGPIVLIALGVAVMAGWSASARVVSSVTKSAEVGADPPAPEQALAHTTRRPPQIGFPVRLIRACYPPPSSHL